MARTKGEIMYDYFIHHDIHTLVSLQSTTNGRIVMTVIFVDHLLSCASLPYIDEDEEQQWAKCVAKHSRKESADMVNNDMSSDES